MRKEMDNIMAFSPAKEPAKAVNPLAVLASLYVAPVRTPTEHLPELILDDLPRNTFWLTLGRAVTLRREYGSATEAAYVGWLVNRLPVTMIDGAGNVHVDIRTDESHRTMFTSHTDSVHRGGGINKVHVDGKFWRASTNSALGADDGAGNAIMAYMIEAGVPGYYVFFRGEECGGIGSKWLADEMPELFNDIDRAVAFDRAGYADVITHQSGSRCCSEEFAQELATALSTDTDWYMPCSGGVYTDTAEFVSLIAECTNISVGYKHQHGDREEQDVEFLWGLAQRCIQVQWDTLTVKRDPKARDLGCLGMFGKGKRKSKGKGKDKKVEDLMEPVPFSMDGAYMSSLKDDIFLGNDEVEDEDEDEGDPEANAIAALEEAIYNDDLSAIVALMAKAVYPEDMTLATQRIKLSRLTVEVLEEAYDALEQGWPADQVLSHLYSDCTEA